MHSDACKGQENRAACYQIIIITTTAKNPNYVTLCLGVQFKQEESTTKVSLMSFFSAIRGAESMNPTHTRLIKTQWRSIDSRHLFIFAAGLFLLSAISALHSGVSVCLVGGVGCIVTGGQALGK